MTWRVADRRARRSELRAGGSGRLSGLPLDAVARARRGRSCSLPEEFHRPRRRRSSARTLSTRTTRDLTRRHSGEPLGERIIVTGRVLDEDGRPLPERAGRGLAGERGRPLPPRGRPAPGPARPELLGRRPLRSPTPRAATASSRSSPAPTRGGTTQNAWRPAHIHFSVFGRPFTQRLVTQMYFPGDPLFPYDPIFNSRSRPEGSRAARSLASTSTTTRARVGARATSGTSCSAGAATGTTPVENGR